MNRYIGIMAGFAYIGGAMLEGEATRRLKKALETHPRLAPVALVQRHVNYYVSGVLDMSISIGQFTLWLELKMLGNKLTALQAHNVKLLGAGACVVTFSKDGKQAVVSGVEGFGWLTFAELVEEIVSRCTGKMFFKGGNGQPPVPFMMEMEKILAPLGYIREYAIGIPRIKERNGGNYKVDFALPSAKVAIECDGRSHSSKKRQVLDRKKDAILHRFGWKIIRVLHD